MTSHSYLNFDLSIERAGEAFRVRVCDPRGGEASAEFPSPLTQLELERFVRLLGMPRRKTRRSDSEALHTAKLMGEKLFEAVFQREVYACFRDDLQQARQQDQGLRLRLRVNPNAAELHDLPWEYLYNAKLNQFLAFSAETPVVRYLELEEPVLPRPLNLPLNVLVVIASPSDLSALDVEDEWARLQQAFTPLLAQKRVTLHRLERPTLDALRRRLRQQEVHVLHFIGHGQFDSQGRDGQLALENASGSSAFVSGQELGVLLHDYRSLRLAVLNACEGARTDPGDPFAGVAHSLVQQGLPAVIAMQFEISDQAARTFAEEFYTALLESGVVDAALAEARKAIYLGGNHIEWGTPVLFTRTEGRIFEVASLPDIQRPVAQISPPIAAAQPLDPSRRMAQPDVTRLFEDGLSAFYLEDWERAEQCFQNALKLHPDHKDAIVKLTQAQQQIDLIGRYRRVQELIDMPDWISALELLEKLTADAPSYRDVGILLQKTRQQVRLAEFYADAARLSQAGQPQAVISIFDQILRIQPDYDDPQSLLATARSKLAAIQQQEKLAGMYRDALGAMESHRCTDAEKSLVQILRLQANYRDAAQLLEKVKAESVRLRSANAPPLLKTPTQLSKAPRWFWLVGGMGALIVLALLCGLAGSWLVSSSGPLAWLRATPKHTAKPTETLTATAESTQLLLSTSTDIVVPTPTGTALPQETPPSSLTPTAWPMQISVTKGVPMALVPAGAFEMGSDADTALAECQKLYIGGDCKRDWYTIEEPIHIGTLDAFYIDVYEVTNARYTECVAAGKCSAPSESKSYTRSSYYDNSQYASYPVINIAWENAKTYCEWRDARLPSEAEWEKAARGGLEGKQYPWGDTFDGTLINFCDKNCPVGYANTDFDDGYADTAPAGSYAPNNYGLYDMAGNVWEWVNDWYNSDYYQNSPTENPTGPASGDYRVLRGGSWYDYGHFVRVAYRNYGDPTYRYSNIGFRCVVSAPGK